MAIRYDAGEVITAMVTPFNEKREIDYPAVEKLARHLADNGSDAILVAGTTGESPTLTHDEEYELLYAVKGTVSGDAKIIMGAGSNSTRTAVDVAKKVETLGADAILSVVPYYNKPNQQGMIEHFGAIAKSTNLPIILYNIPSRTGVNMLPQTVAFLAKEYSNIVALKQSNSDLDLISELKAQCPKDFAIYCGDDSLTLPMLSLGAHGVVSVASHVVGEEIKSMIHNYKSGQVKAARNMHQTLFPLFKKLFMAPNPVPVKAVLSRLKLIENYVRRPLFELNELERSELFDCLNSVLDALKNN
ncbi:TPA: 4-hydroxy-tetrahydrodipicolinate synthase [Candidatus Galligastranaerophilus intestinavium]|uniref:4-hydroxy-tetrahydrodipicolinate synthase n=1 Tax=Candidatus Galligastranaerophilus intestinavium TaxID=2840836 RepID=A0A9D1FHQ4_9BACT|nr:4-hydroxy-tetrahydrodipicolinate synthase [Candidatus Galligastranaerophilus intestinavium]